MQSHQPASASGSYSRLRARPAPRGVRLAALTLAALCPGVGAQEALRLAEESAATEARFRELTETPGYHPMRIGPVRVTASAGLRMEYTDNANLSTDSGDDFIITPNIGLGLYWPVAEFFTLNLGANVGYAFYMDNSDYNRFTTSGGPSTALSFNFKVGDVFFNVHDRLSISTSLYEDSTAYSTASNDAGAYTSLNNVAGLGAVWDMGKLKWNSGYDHVTTMALDSDAASLSGDRDSDTISTGLPYAFRPNLSIGPTASVSWSSYSGGLSTDSFQWSAGGSIQWQLTEHAGVDFGVGYTVYAYDAASPSAPTVPGLYEPPSGDGESDGIYFSFAWRHQPNRIVSYTVSLGHSLNGDYYGGAYESFNAAVSANWRLIREVGLSTYFSYTHGEGIAGYSQVYDYYGAGIVLSRRLMRQLNASLSYSFYYRQTDDFEAGEYTANTVALMLTYSF